MENKKEISIIELIASFIFFIKKYFWILLTFFVVGIAIGLLDFYFGKKYYKTTLIATSPAVNNQIVYELIIPIKLYIINEQYDSVAIKFNISKELASEIRSFDMDTSISQAVKINLEVYNKDKVGDIATGFMNYLNNIPFIANALNQKQSYLQIKLSELNKEIDDLNKLQESIISNVKNQSNSGVVYSGGMFNEMLALYDRKTLLEEEIANLQSFKVVNSNMFYKSNKSIFKSLVLFGFIGILLGFLIAYILYIRAKLKKNYQG